MAAQNDRPMTGKQQFLQRGHEEHRRTFQSARSSCPFLKPTGHCRGEHVFHGIRAGLCISSKCEVVDFSGNVIPGLYCGGENAGGFSMHGLAQCVVQGRIGGRNAVAGSSPVVPAIHRKARENHTS